MSSGMVGLAELQATVQRMEASLSALQHPQVGRLMLHYKELCLRYQADLSASPRDVALARASALMLVQAVAKAENAA